LYTSFNTNHVAIGGYHIGGMNICGLGVGHPYDLIGSSPIVRFLGA
jgi:hypothetical protein